MFHGINIRTAQLAVWVGLLLTLFILWFSNSYLTDRFTEDQRARSLQRATLYTNSISSALQRTAYVPLLLSRDPTLISALQSNDYTNTTQRLISFKEDLAAASIFLMDIDGRIVAGSDRRIIGSRPENPEYFVRALRETETVFETPTNDGVVNGFYYARKLQSNNQSIGVIVVEVDLQRQEQIWRSGNTQAVLSDSRGQIMLSTNLDWRKKSLPDLLSSTYRPTASERLFGGHPEDGPQAFVYLNGERLLVSDVKVGFLGWHLSYFASLENVQARVNAIIALELMVLSLLAAFVFFLISRRTAKESVQIQAESQDLRQLNTRLSNEIEQRQRAEKNLETAEQSLEQASKLASLGQMSASVSHELNQPLAAMRTYLAGAKLLMQRNRVAEAVTSFQRIDDLIERMGVITNQLKSHARKGDNDKKVIDMRDCVTAALSLMSPQLGKTQVTIVRNIAENPAKIVGDSVRVEQIIVNLLRNALDAVKTVDNKKITICVEVDDWVRLTVQDNGTGIEDVDALFEPFSTTKKPGEGVGLGLAISAGFATDMGGKLTGRNATPVGAIFTMTLPKAGSELKGTA